MGMNNMDNYMEQMAVLCENNDSINKNLYSEYGVKRGLRDENGQGVLTGLTNIQRIQYKRFCCRKQREKVCF